MNLPFTHLRVDLNGLTVAGEVWRKGDFVPLDGSTTEPVHPDVLERCAALQHPHLTAGNLEVIAGDVDDGEPKEMVEFHRLKKPVKIEAEKASKKAAG